VPGAFRHNSGHRAALLSFFAPPGPLPGVMAIPHRHPVLAKPAIHPVIAFSLRDRPYSRHSVF
jgi:hypothetical protein